jgi:Toprim domain
VEEPSNSINNGHSKSALTRTAALRQKRPITSARFGDRDGYTTKRSLRAFSVRYMFSLSHRNHSPIEPDVTEQIVITEKTSQAKDVRSAVGSRYGDILPAEGHLFDLLEPADVVPEWKRWSPILLRPGGLYGTRPAEGGNKATKLKAIREALRTAKRVWLATDCDREGQLIGQEILEHYEYRGQVMRVLFTAQDSQTMSDLAAQSQMPNTHAFMPPPSRAGRPTRSTTCPLPALRPSSWVAARAE